MQGYPAGSTGETTGGGGGGGRGARGGGPPGLEPGQGAQSGGNVDLLLYNLLMVGLSRLYVGVHYPLDVVAGYAAGLAWTGLCTAAVGVLHRYSQRHGPSAP
jgi:PAP2 superfamily protein